MTARIAIVGIDGAGKSTLIRRLLQRDARGGAVVIHCPSYHQDPDAPLGALSRAHEAYSQAADALASFELKASALYLQMTLFGPVERAIAASHAPRLLVCERHPVIDTLAYGPFYRRMVRAPVDAGQVEARLAAEIDRRAPGGYAAVRAWHARENDRLGLATSFWDVGAEVCALLARPHADLVGELCRRYRTTLPDRVVWLDVAAAEARDRVAARTAAGQAELHESAEYLGALRHSYAQALAALGRDDPAVKIATITTGGRAVDACLDELMEEIRDATAA